MVGGVLEIKIHPAELRHVPRRVSTFIQNPELLAKVRTTATTVKRWGEQAIARDEEKKLELALLYIKEDVERLRSLQSDESTAPVVVTAQAQQLTHSLAIAETSLRAVSVDTVLKMQERSQSSIAIIREALQHLQSQRDAQKEEQKSFADTVAALEEKFTSVVALTGSGSQQSSVAGAQDKNTPQPSPSASPAIPLTF